MCSGIWPPSKRLGTWYRALVPLVPRPAVLPLDASPRPTRVFAVLAPGAGRRWWSLSVMSVGLLDRHEGTGCGDHAPVLGTVLLDDHVADPLQAEGAQRLALVGLAADRRALLLDLELGHQEVTSPPPAAPAAGCSARALRSAAGATCSTGRPRRAATASGCSSMRSASTVAWTMLIWFDEPSDLLRTSWMPAHSRTAR